MNNPLQFHHIHFPEIDSTNAYLKQHKSTLPIPTIITAGFQTSGRGQQSNTWHSEPNQNLLCSILLSPDFLKIPDQFILSQAVALSVIDTLTDLLPNHPFQIKWPNDIYINHKKIAGILIETYTGQTTLQHTIIGIGLNINQTSFPSYLPNPTSLASLTFHPFDLSHCQLSLQNHLSSRYLQIQSPNLRPSIQQQYLQLLYQRDIPAPYIIKGSRTTATIKSVSPIGELLIELPTKQQLLLHNKEIVFLQN